MIGTLFSIFIGIALYFFPFPEKGIEASTPLVVILFIVASLFLVVQTAITLFAWGPMRRLEDALIPHVVDSFKSDRNLKVTNFFLLFFLLFTYLISIDLLIFHVFPVQYSLIFWTLALGVAVDLMHHHLSRTLDFLSPLHVLEHHHQKTLECIAKSQEVELCQWIDAFSETSLKALESGSYSLSQGALEKLQLTAKNYLEVAKGITYHEDEGNGKFGGSDHVSYTLFYLFQRLEQVFFQALAEHVEPICSQVITVLGKITLHAAKYDMSLASYPLHYLGKFASIAQEDGLDEVANRATATLTLVAQVIVDEVDFQYVEIKEAFLSIITTLHELAKGTFRKDKEMNIELLVQPFEELLLLFKSEKVSKHQDGQALVFNTQNVINEFAALESIMRTVPNIPGMERGEGEEEEE